MLPIEIMRLGGSRVPVWKFMIITSGTSFTAPSDWNSSNNKVHCIGAGADGGAGGDSTNAGDGGGAGAYACKNNLALTPGASVSCRIGTVGGTTHSSGTAHTWVDSNSTVRAAGVGTGTAGATAFNSVGDVKYDGGDGATHVNTSAGGGGGAAGPDAAGVDGTTSDGGAGNGGSNGGGAGGSNGVGSPGTTWTDNSGEANDGTSAGAGGGGDGAGFSGSGYAAGNYGAGGGGGSRNGGAGGAGAPGVIVLEWLGYA